MKYLFILLLLLPFAQAENYYYAGDNLVASEVNDLDYVYSDRMHSSLANTYLPFGQELNDEERFAFQQKERDGSGLVHIHARVYDSSLGRFTRIDPVEDSYVYAFARNNPLKFIDPDGQKNYIFTDKSFEEQAKSAKDAFETHFGEEFELFVLEDMAEFKEVWDEADLNGENDIVLLFMEGADGNRLWWTEAHEGFARSEFIANIRREETGAKYYFPAEFFGQKAKAVEHLCIFSCRTAVGIQNPFGSVWRSYDSSVVTAFLNAGVQNVYAGFEYMSFSEREGVIFPRTGNALAKLFKWDYNWYKFYHGEENMNVRDGLEGDHVTYEKSDFPVKPYKTLQNQRKNQDED